MSLLKADQSRTIPARPDTRFVAGMATVDKVNVTGLEKQLRRHVSGEVRFDTATLAMYANDASNFRQVPIGVVVPKTIEDVVQTVRACHAYHAPVLCRGGGTSLSGETVNVAVVIDFSKYLTDIIDIDAPRRLATVQTGVINEQLNKATGEHGLVFGPDPSSHSRCTLGGNIGNNSCGVHSVQSRFYGPGPRTSDNTHALDIVTYDGARFTVGVNEEKDLDAIIAAGGRKGEIYAALRDLRNEYADDIRKGYADVEEVPRRVSGYNLDELLPERGFNVARALVGTESTCAVALTATVMLTPAMLHRTVVVVEFDSLGAAGDLAPEMMEWKPIGLEAVDHMLVHDQELTGTNAAGRAALPRPDSHGAWLMIQFGSDEPHESLDRAEEFVRWLKKKKHVEDDRIVLARSKQDGGNSAELWAIREAGWARRRSRWTAAITGRGGRTPRSPGGGSVTTCVTCSSSTPNTTCAAPCTATSGRAASTRGSGSTCVTRTVLSTTATSWRRPVTWSRPTAGRCPASTATASSAPSCCTSSTVRG